MSFVLFMLMFDDYFNVCAFINDDLCVLIGINFDDLGKYRSVNDVSLVELAFIFKFNDGICIYGFEIDKSHPFIFVYNLPLRKSIISDRFLEVSSIVISFILPH